ncbi:cysteine/glutathione ABC transporter permease/ATP-binding protein CydD [Endozoicomonas sp. SCSIO W0465]|uniref:heme ABC transporter permease/ATP-binding protein CydD n=1 Tax=Endozoicomonas sp. SCSIO W0465 TaxID=2918516 RepID=UPI002074C9A4|nr:cysteine/glutathione ABC transporter permease/ATP-binding protein CydD [Endozoicomonas sp. SCSIO W0465]USE39082.1 cysteine/glutathione ABC transporter permease/ATP-binding protein CydD [Endozoicomonas sp. SCSIO W0465]
MRQSSLNITQKQAYRWLLRQIRPARQWLMASMILGLINGIFLIIQASVMAGMIHQLVMESASREGLTEDFLWVLLLVLVRGACTWGREFCGFQAGAAIRVEVRKLLLDKLCRLGPLVIAERPAGSWSAIAVEQVEELQEFIAKYLPQMALAVMIPAVILLVAFPQSWVVGIIFLGTAPLIPVFMILVGMKAAQANRKNFQALSRLGGFFLDRLHGLETLKIFQRTRFAQTQLADASEDFRIKTMQVLRLAFLSSAVLEFFASVSIALVAVFLGMSFLGHITFGGDVTLYTGLFLLLLAPEYYQPLRELGTYYHAKAKAVGATEEILEVLSRKEPEAHRGGLSLPEAVPLTIEAKELSVSATIRSAADSEPTGDSEQQHPLLLDRLSFKIEPGTRVGIIGSSGAGKTTLINTLMGFWSYQGEITVGGQLLADTQLDSWRKQIAWLGQHPLIIQGTVYDNIVFGRQSSGCAVSHEQCLEALARAQGMDIIASLPDGLNSVLKEQGGNLSVGQAQRIALARALLLPVRLLILDEPTASLDSVSESLVLDALAAIPDDCTVITITHRISQLNAMDQILMLDKGKLVADGSPATLAGENSLYQQFISMHSHNHSFQNSLYNPLYNTLHKNGSLDDE